MIEISVIGSCVARDLFEKDNGENFSFHTDIRFQSPISMLAKPVNFIKADFIHLTKKVPTVGGNWYKKNLINDINKTSFDALKERHGEYLILDLGESRISLAELSWPNKEDKLLVSNSVSFRSHYSANLSKNILKGTKIKSINPLEYSDDYWKQTIKEFATSLLDIFKEEKIILIKTKPARYFVDINGFIHPYYSKNHFESIMLCDILLDKLYDYFVEICPKCKVVEIPECALGYQGHKWGNHPFHFTELLYDYLLKCVLSIAKNNDVSKLSNLYDEYKELFKNEYFDARYKTGSEQKSSAYDTIDLLTEYEEFNHLGRRKQAMILFALDKKHFLKNYKRVKKKNEY